MRSFFFAILFLSLVPSSYAMDQEAYFNKVTDAIYIAEGGLHARKPFGVLSIDCKEYKDCRAICLNSVRKGFARWKRSQSTESFISFLGRRYCPSGVHDTTGLNKNWERNVKFYLKKWNASEPIH